MRYIFYHYNEYGTLVFDYYDDETHVSQSYVFYTLIYHKVFYFSSFNALGCVKCCRIAQLNYARQANHS